MRTNGKSILREVPFMRISLDPHLREVAQGASITFVLKTLGAGFSFGFNVLLARMLGADGAGVYLLALTVTTIATVFGRIGLDNALLRFIAANAAEGDWQAVKGSYQKGVRLAVGASAASTLIVFASAPWLANVVFTKPDLAHPLRWMSLAITPFALLTLHAESLKGLKRIRDSQLVQGVGVPILSLACLYLLGQTWGVKGAVWAYLVASTVTAAAGYLAWRAATPQLKDIEGQFETRQLLQSSMPLFWVASLNLLTNWTLTFMLGIWGTKTDVGIFGMASRTAFLIGFVLVAVNSIAAPKFAALHKQGDFKALESTARTSAKWVTLIASPALLFFVLAPEWIMQIFGPQFSEGATALAILSIGQFINVATGSVGYLLMMSGHERLMRNNIIFIFFFNLILGAIMTVSYGITGAAIAFSISLSLKHIISVWLVRRNIGVWVVPFIGRGSEG